MIHSIKVSEHVLRGILALVSDLVNCAIRVTRGSISVYFEFVAVFWVLEITENNEMIHNVPNVSANSQFYAIM